jgi:uncharacterized linocin/CFP29 family protein
MNGNLGRDRVWNDQIWSEIDKAVREEVGRIRVAQKVFPTTTANNVLPVATNIFVPAPPPPPPLALQPDVFQPFLEISREFVLTHAQVDGEENIRLAAPLARLAASAIAAAEDTILFFGPAQIAAVLATGVTVTNQPGALPPGFVAVAAAAAFPPVGVAGATPRGAPPPPFVGDIIGAVAQGIANLTAQAQPGPYALFVPPSRYAQAFAPAAPGMLMTPGDQINHVVTGGFYMVNSLTIVGPPPPPDTGILVSLGGEPAKIILGNDAMTAFLFTDGQGNYHFRVFERIQLVVRDGRAFQTLQF